MGMASGLSPASSRAGMKKAIVMRAHDFLREGPPKHRPRTLRIKPLAWGDGEHLRRRRTPAFGGSAGPAGRGDTFAWPRSDPGGPG